MTDPCNRAPSKAKLLDLLREARNELTNYGSAHVGGDYDETCSQCILVADIDAVLDGARATTTKGSSLP